jgi:phosphatidylserine/phosphatidylglycerophosphate/cardiolipin synthase-like enzyme
MLAFLRSTQNDRELISSRLLNEDSFYEAFIKDLNKCQSEVIIESPFITSRRVATLLPILEKLKRRNVRVAINTRDPFEHTDNEYMREEAHRSIADLQHSGIHVIFTNGHHRKLAILDRKLLYEGSLNILSQNNSREVMRRIESVQLAWQMAKFVGIDKALT